MKRSFIVLVIVTAVVAVVLTLLLVWPHAPVAPEQLPPAEPARSAAKQLGGKLLTLPGPDQRAKRESANAVERSAPEAEKKRKESNPAQPFLAGEQLSYRIRWSYFPAAATVELKVVEQRSFYSRPAWHFQAIARTLSPVRSIYELDDQFDSYSDTATLRSYQFEIHLREQGKEQKRIVQLLRGSELPRPDGASTQVPDETRDALGLIYYLRTVDWQLRPELRLPVYDGRTLYDVRARRDDAAGFVEVPAGNYAATRISLRVLHEGKEVPSTRFQLWLANDAARTPVLIEAELPFGSLRVELQPRAGT